MDKGPLFISHIKPYIQTNYYLKIHRVHSTNQTKIILNETESTPNIYCACVSERKRERKTEKYQKLFEKKFMNFLIAHCHG